MLTYEVTVAIDPRLASALERYLIDRHLPDMLGTGCFAAIHLERRDDSTYRSRYQCATPTDLDRYLADHAAAMRADFAAHFPSGATVTRANWTHLRSFGG